ncbi:hypothetical protein ABZ766_19925 [Streptomyces sp. NPDC006670]|uniref:hypothetical protein n=1 Tax=Streptomyces sp. NPDC006670 TaxID=3154476 RepID=UPI0033D74306
MSLAPALRAALVTAAIAGATLLGTQMAQADATAPAPTAPAAPAAPQATPSPTSTTATNPWD